MNTKTMLAAAAVLLLLSANSCANKWDEITNPYKELELSTKSSEFVQQGNSFALDFIDSVNSAADGDFIISPLSMQFLLGMILNGAQGGTADEICKVLGYGAGEVPQVNDYCLSMLKQLPELDKKTTLKIANAIFVDEGWPLLDGYKSEVGKYYRAEVSNLNFADGARSAGIINKWCSDRTGGKITKMLDSTSPEILAYLLNAMYFKSQWKEKFEKSNTVPEDFTDELGVKNKVNMMKQNKSHPYTENHIFKAVRMPYGNGAFSMTAILPMEGHTLAEVTAALKESDWDSMSHDMYTCTVDLWIPKFETKSTMKLNDLLADMGMPAAFDKEKADFKALSPYALHLKFVQQDAIIKVDEEGTEAAVVSFGGFGKTTAAGPEQTVEFHAERPFLYLISENSTGAILFAGRYGKTL